MMTEELTDEKIVSLRDRAALSFESRVHVDNVVRDCEIALDTRLPDRVRSEARRRCTAWNARLLAKLQHETEERLAVCGIGTVPQ